MTAPLFTAEYIIALAPCWVTKPEPGRDVAALRRIVGDGITARAIVEDERVSVDDRRWVLCHLLARGPRPNLPALVRWACGCALDVVDQITDVEAHTAARQTIETTIRWSVGDATVEEVREAREVLWARWGATDDATDSATCAAAYYATEPPTPPPVPPATPPTPLPKPGAPPPPPPPPRIRPPLAATCLPWQRSSTGGAP